MAIKRVEENGKFKYEVIVKIRDKSGKQVHRKRRWFYNERDAKKAEFELRTELEGHKTKVTWTSGSTHDGTKNSWMKLSRVMFTMPFLKLLRRHPVIQSAV